MTKLRNLTASLIALGVASPAFAHETGLAHIHNEGAVIATATIVAVAGVVAWKFIAERSRK